MSTLEVISPHSKSELPMLDTPDSLVQGIREMVRRGITDYFDDVAWVHYYGTIERMQTLADPAFQKLLSKLDRQTSPNLVIDESTRPNIFPSIENLVQDMASKKGQGGAFHRVNSLDEKRFVALPARLDVDKDEVEVDLSHGISFDGHSLVTALFNEGVGAEVIDYRGEPAFSAYRDREIGCFFVKHAFSS